MSLQIEVGKKYHDRDGGTVEITGTTDEKGYAFEGTSETHGFDLWTADGHFFRHLREDEWDLVEEIPTHTTQGYTVESVEAALCVWEWFCSTAKEGERETFKGLCGEGAAEVRMVVADYVGPEAHLAWEHVGFEACEDAGYDSFDWDYIPAYCGAMVKLEINAGNLADHRNDILREMGLLKSEPDVVGVELDHAQYGSRQFYGVYLRLAKDSDGHSLTKFVEDTKVFSEALDTARGLAYKYKVPFTVTTATEIVREVA